ncbi:MAG: nucleotide exchange factor GrpE [Paracoccaceae bacterium]|jgi:molecular chaperone GrpE|nr:nucleotide exchange factor GrpE [Paracoccaceae bacterium]MDG1372840.1 nucleotide exchange factor GrpE [Paracoccaceae bacterium]
MSDKEKAPETPHVEMPEVDTSEIEGAAERAANFDFETALNTDFGDELGGDALGGDETITALINQIGDLTAERDELNDKLMRALAEAQNIRRRAERDRKDAEAFGGTKLARDLLEVHDNFDRALASADDAAKEHAAGLIEGVELTQKGLLSAFAKHRIEKVAPEVGEKFDANFHQAMFEAPVPGAEPNTVIEVMQPGFTIAGRLLRPALVGVAKPAPAS